MRADFIDLLSILKDFEGVAPTNLTELKAFELDCRDRGFNSIANWLRAYITDMEAHKQAEWDIGDKASVGWKS
jgi:hypothetical protein